MPSSAITLVYTTLDEISRARGGGKLSLGILAALWAASNGMGAICDTLNSAYGVKEQRPWWKVRLVAICLTIAVSILIVMALVIVLYGGHIGDRVATFEHDERKPLLLLEKQAVEGAEQRSKTFVSKLLGLGDGEQLEEASRKLNNMVVRAPGMAVARADREPEPSVQLRSLIEVGRASCRERV